MGRNGSEKPRRGRRRLGLRVFERSRAVRFRRPQPDEQSDFVARRHLERGKPHDLARCVDDGPDESAEPLRWDLTEALAAIVAGTIDAQENPVTVIVGRR